MLLSSPAAQAAPVVIERVRPDKVLYSIGEKATAAIIIRNTSTESISGELVVTEEWDISKERPIWHGDVALPALTAKTFEIDWQINPPMYGRVLRASFRQAGKEIARGVEFYQAADPKECFRTFILNMGGDQEREPADTDPFVTYGNYDNHFGYALSGFSHLAPSESEWVTGQNQYNIVKEKLKKRINDRKSIGVRAGAYTIGATAGPAGYELARQHPEWFLRNKKGAFTTYGTPVNPLELAQGTDKTLTTWYALQPDFGNPEVVECGGKEIVRAIDMFGWDSIFFDGIYAIHSDFVGPNEPVFTWDHRPAGRDVGEDHLSAYAVRRTREIIREAYPNVALFYNGSSPRPDHKLLKAVTASLQDRNCGELLEFQGAQLSNPSFHGHQWNSLLGIYVGARDILLNNREIDDPVLTTGFLYNMHLPHYMNPDELKASRDTWTAANHLMALMLAARIHPCVLNSSGFRPGTQFMTRYSALLWARDVKLLKNAWRGIKVESNKEVWWEDTVYRRQGEGFTDTFIHLINAPEDSAFNIKASQDPPAAKYVEIEVKVSDPEKTEVWALKPYGYDSRQREPEKTELRFEKKGNNIIVELPAFHYYTLVIVREKR